MKSQKINLRFWAFWPVIFLIFPDICQRVTCKYFKINMLKIEKNEISCLSGQFVQNGVFAKLSGKNGPEAIFYYSKNP